MQQAKTIVSEDQVRQLSADVGRDYEPAAHGSAGQASDQESWNRHPVNLRLTIPLLFGRCYVTVVAGKERRSSERLSAERRKHPLWTLGNLSVIFGLGCFCGLALLALFQLASAYILTKTGIMVVPK